jgi:eukaryotic-like serine/threonine-protein kinase
MTHGRSQFPLTCDAVAACPPDEVVAALLHNALPDDEADTLRSHFDVCESCAELVAVLVRAKGTDVSSRMPRRPFDPNTPLAAGSQLGRYEIRELLAVGGMGHVYEAHDRELERAVALKVLRPELEDDESFAERLARESRLMARITHRAVITVYDVGRDHGRMFIAMELVRGETLGAFLARVKPPWRTVLELFERAGNGLSAAHQAGIVHRDFKPENVLVETDGDVVKRVVVTDFGIARKTLSSPDTGSMRDIELTAAGTRIGTPAYMAPEQLAGQPVDHRADVFSFASSIWEALFGARPFTGNSVDEIRRAFTTRPRAPQNAPFGVERVLQRGLAVDPSERWPDMKSFVAQLERLRTRRRRLAIGVGAATLVLVGIGGVALAVRPTHLDRCAHAPSYGPIPLYLHMREPAVVRSIEAFAQAWRETHQATCKADAPVTQDPAVAACLAARELEIVGAAEALVQHRGTFGREFTALIVSPRQCAGPAPIGSASAVPADPALRREVSSLRKQRFELFYLAADGDTAAAIAGLERLVEPARKLWPPLQPEVMFALGSLQASSGNRVPGQQLIREAAAIAQSLGVDRIAVRAWTQLALSASSDEHDPRRGLEYLTYAEAALERYGRAPTQEVQFLYAKGATLVELGRTKEAEATFGIGLELALVHEPAMVYLFVLGLGYTQEADARYKDAIATYRRAFGAFAASPQTVVASHETNLHTRLAVSLLMLGRPDEAEPEARKAAELGERYLTPDSVDRALMPVLVADALHDQGRYIEAIAVVRRAKTTIENLTGDQSRAYAEATRVEANITRSLGNVRAAMAGLETSCALLPLTSNDGVKEGVECLLDRAEALLDLGKHATALSLLARTEQTALAAYSPTSPAVARLYATMGNASLGLGKQAAALASLERALAILEVAQIDPGRVAATRFALAKAVWSTDRKRASELVQRAVAELDEAAPRWANTRHDAVAWLASHAADR